VGNRVIFGYVPKSEKIKVEETGTGGLTEMLDSMSDGKVHYCFMRFKVNAVYKFVYIAWCGEGVAGLRKGSFASHSVDMGKLLHVRPPPLSPSPTRRSLTNRSHW
jgi:hypothetical protein